MKPTIQVIQNDEQNGFIIIMEKKLSNPNDIYTTQKEMQSFTTTERKVFIRAIDMSFREILRQFGILPYDKSKSSIEAAFDTLKRKYNTTIEIVDRYKDTKETIVDREDYITVINENGILSCANEIVVREISV